ncbi:unnamed protein product [Ixodes pacificus]
MSQSVTLSDVATPMDSRKCSGVKHGQMRASPLLKFPCTVKLESDLRQNGRMSHPPPLLRLCRDCGRRPRQLRSWRHSGSTFDGEDAHFYVRTQRADGPSQRRTGTARSRRLRASSERTSARARTKTDVKIFFVTYVVVETPAASL